MAPGLREGGGSYGSLHLCQLDAYNLGYALSMLLSSKEEDSAEHIRMMTRMISSMGAIQLAEIRLTQRPSMS
jgi:hypothetical protein